ncbi:MAG: serine/threonine protein kinase [Robiginitomaculum sp.]|nr:MAG: serine/threonine protein kinase [Robiginitomaculum sp.]
MNLAPKNDNRLADTTVSAIGLVLSFGGYSDAGTKTRNDDALAARLPENQQESQYKGAVACIADGISVSERSHIASQMSVTQFISDYYATPEAWSVDVSASRVLKALNDWLCAQSRHNQASAMVTTFSACILKSHTFHIFHIGDSAIYRCRGDEIRVLTRDHNLNVMNKAAVLTAALGMDPRLNVDYSKISASVGDIMILLTDGVSSVLEEKDFARLLATKPKTAQELDDVSKIICELAVSRGSEDNVSCGLLYVAELPSENIDEAHRRVQALQIPPVMKVGHKLDGFEVKKILHTGTRSHIYAVSDTMNGPDNGPNNGKEYVLKVPSLNFADDPVYLEGFIREQWVGRRLAHKNIMHIYAPREESAFLYHICEPVQGQTLRDWMIDHPKPSVVEVREILENIIPALRAMHRMGMVHRDIKPENIMITHKGDVKIIDFGTVQVAGMDEIASAISEDGVVGSVQYSAPEYILGNAATPNSDLFALGCIHYEMLCGRRPYADMNGRMKSFSDWTYMHANAVRTDIPLWIDAALEKACAPNPAHRYSTLSEFLADFTRPGSAARRRQSDTSLLERNPLAFWKGLSGVLFLIIIILLALLTRNGT